MNNVTSRVELAGIERRNGADSPSADRFVGVVR